MARYHARPAAVDGGCSLAQPQHGPASRRTSSGNPPVTRSGSPARRTVRGSTYFFFAGHLLGCHRSLLLPVVFVGLGLLLTRLLAHCLRRFVAHVRLPCAPTTADARVPKGRRDRARLPFRSAARDSGCDHSPRVGGRSTPGRAGDRPGAREEPDERRRGRQREHQNSRHPCNGHSSFPWRPQGVSFRKPGRAFDLGGNGRHGRATGRVPRARCDRARSASANAMTSG